MTIEEDIHSDEQEPMEGDYSDEDMEEEGEQQEAADEKPKKVYIPGVSRPLKEGEELDYDPEAYRIFHTFETEIPCLSFDIVNDNLGDNREASPMTAYIVGGTQAEKTTQNELIVMKLTNMHANTAAAEDDDSSSDEDLEDDEDDKAKGPKVSKKDPIMHAAAIRHFGDVNRIKTRTIGSTEVCAVWNATGKVQIWNLSNALNALNAIEENITKKVKLDSEKPLHSFAGHNTEGFALGWSPLKEGTLASGDNKNKIYVWQMSEGGAWAVSQRPLTGHTSSVEDVQWSHTEEPLLISASCDKTIRLWDTRAPAQQSCVCTVEKAHESDVNVISWNKQEPLIVSGSDDAELKVWSLQTIQYGQPVARFKHHKSPITSVEWAHHDSTTFMASGEDNQITFWDLSMETESGANEDIPGLPPQLLFVHQGLTEIKEVHWHPKITGLALATAFSGYHVFRTINI